MENGKAHFLPPFEESTHPDSFGHYVGLIHMQIPPPGYLGLISRSTIVVTASHSTIEGTMRVL